MWNVFVYTPESSQNQYHDERRRQPQLVVVAVVMWRKKTIFCLFSSMAIGRAW